MKKKCVALLMTAVMLLMTGCGSSAGTATAIVAEQKQQKMYDAYANSVNKEQESTVTYEETYEQDEQWTAEGRPDETASAEEWDQYVADEITRIIQGDETFSFYDFGEFTEYGYRSEYLGYRFVIPENCRLLLARELFTQAGFTDEEISASYDDVKSQYERLDEVPDLFAFYPNTGTCICVAVDMVDTYRYTIEDAMQNCMQVIEESSDGALKTDGTFEEVEFAGHTYMKAVAKMDGACQEVYGMFLDDRFVYITIAYLTENASEADTLRNAMKPIENKHQNPTYMDLYFAGVPETEIGAMLDESRKSKFFFGTFTNKGYQSDCLKYSFTTPSGWKLGDYSQLAELSGMDNSVTDSNFAQKITEYAYDSEVCELYAIKESTGSIVSVWAGTPLYSDDDLEWKGRVDYDLRIQQYSTTDWGNLCSRDVSYVEIAGREYVKVVVDIKDGQAQYVEEQYRAISNNEDYLIAITYQLGNEADRDEILKAFSTLQ